MKRIRLPGTDLLVSRLSFGTARLHHLPTSDRRQALLGAALAHGFTHVDTSPYYGFGLAEVEVGRCLMSRDVTVASKVGLYPPPGGLSSSTASVWLRKGLGRIMPALSRPTIDWSIATASRSLERSLRRLRRDHLDILFLHEPTPASLSADELLRWLEQQRDLGKVRYWGLAGQAERFESWIRDNHGLAQVLQVKDETRDHAGVDNGHPVLEAGRPFQFTYGYLAAARVRSGRLSVVDVLRGALSRNRSGSVLVSTRHTVRVAQLAYAVAA